MFRYTKGQRHNPRILVAGKNKVLHTTIKDYINKFHRKRTPTMSALSYSGTVWIMYALYQPKVEHQGKLLAG